MKVFEKVYQVVRKIPAGKVMTYGDVGKLVGTSGRVVGFALHSLRFVQGKPPDFSRGGEPTVVPCHRVVDRNGRLAPHFAFGGAKEQYLRLKHEGVIFRGDSHVDLAKSA